MKESPAHLPQKQQNLPPEACVATEQQEGSSELILSPQLIMETPVIAPSAPGGPFCLQRKCLNMMALHHQQPDLMAYPALLPHDPDGSEPLEMIGSFPV